MINIYDILLNLSEKPYEFYEWNQSDKIIHVKKAPLIKINEKDFDTFFNSKIQIDDIFLSSIKNRTELYNKNYKRNNIVLVTDGLRSLGIKFNTKGESISKSKLLLDEEEEILELSYKLEPIEIKYEIIAKEDNNEYETRLEKEVRYFLKTELDYSYKEKQVEKLQYLYIEYFGKRKEDMEEIYIELKRTLDKNLTEKHFKIYELLHLSKKNKLVAFKYS